MHSAASQNLRLDWPSVWGGKSLKFLRKIHRKIKDSGGPGGLVSDLDFLVKGPPKTLRTQLAKFASRTNACRKQAEKIARKLGLDALSRPGYVM